MKTKSAFSILELLAAIIIIAVLMLIGGGVYHRMQQLSIVTSDVHNLRQIGVGANLYTRENNGVLPPVVGRVDGRNVYAHEFIAQKLGILEDLRATDFKRETWGPFISKADRGEPPYVSPLRSYGVNIYAGDVVTLAYIEVKMVKRITEVTYPAQTLYFVPMVRDTTDPNAQARFSDITVSNTAAGTFRTNRQGQTIALWMDGHVSQWGVPTRNEDLAKVALPKRN